MDEMIIQPPVLEELRAEDVAVVNILEEQRRINSHLLEVGHEL
jgi:hypothetical protein